MWYWYKQVGTHIGDVVMTYASKGGAVERHNAVAGKQEALGATLRRDARDNMLAILCTVSKGWSSEESKVLALIASVQSQ